MSVKELLINRSSGVCELCGNPRGDHVHVLAPKEEAIDSSVLVCESCVKTLAEPSAHENHWRCLSESMWSEHLSVQVLTWRVLNAMNDVSWAQDLKSQMYLDDEALEWAQAGVHENLQVLDSNGALLSAGDSVTLIKDLVVKGAGFTAKRGTLVKNIRLTDDPKHIEGKLNGSLIVLVAAYLKKV